jgi:hypothetical protein
LRLAAASGAVRRKAPKQKDPSMTLKPGHRLWRALRGLGPAMGLAPGAEVPR